MMPIPFASLAPSPHSLPPRSQADRAREEQAFYERADGEPWQAVAARIAGIRLSLTPVGVLTGLAYPAR